MAGHCLSLSSFTFKPVPRFLSPSSKSSNHLNMDKVYYWIFLSIILEFCSVSLSIEELNVDWASIRYIPAPFLFL